MTNIPAVWSAFKDTSISIRNVSLLIRANLPLHGRQVVICAWRNCRRATLRWAVVITECLHKFINSFSPGLTFCITCPSIYILENISALVSNSFRIVLLLTDCDSQLVELEVERCRMVTDILLYFQLLIMIIFSTEFIDLSVIEMYSHGRHNLLRWGCNTFNQP